MKNKITQEEFEKTFLGFRSHLNSYLLRITGNRQDAEDIAQSTYIKAVHHLNNFLGKSSLKSWVFTIATNLVRDHQRARQRWTANCQENARTDAYAHPELITAMKNVSTNSIAGDFEIMEHIDFCFTCMAKTLTIEQQISLILKDIYGFTMAEIGEITKLSEGKIKHSLVDARKTLIHIFQHKCAFVSKKGTCHQCTELNQIFNPLQDTQQEALKIKINRERQKGIKKEHLYRLRVELVKAIDPLKSQGTDLHSYFLDLMPNYCDDMHPGKSVVDR